MPDIEGSDHLGVWLRAQPPEFACVLAARAALRVVPVLENVLHEEAEERRSSIVLPSFLALAAANFASVRPERRAEVRDTARRAGRHARTAIGNSDDKARVSIDEAREFLPPMKEVYERIQELKDDLYFLRTTARAIDAIVQSVQALVDATDANRGIANPDSVYESTVASVVAAQDAVKGIREDTAELWRALRLDTEFLEASVSDGGQPNAIVSDIAEQALWSRGISGWAGRLWADFKDELPNEEGWSVWINWYEARLMGQATDADQEFACLNISADDWIQGPTHSNAIIANRIAARADPLHAAVSHGFEELDAVRQDSAVDLTLHNNRIRDALSKDPYLAIGATKDMLEAVMKTILQRQGRDQLDRYSFSKLIGLCFEELRLAGKSPPKSEVEKHSRRIASCAKKMIETTNQFRNKAGTGHGRAMGDELAVTPADASLIASTGLILAAWLLRHDMER